MIDRAALEQALREVEARPFPQSGPLRRRPTIGPQTQLDDLLSLTLEQQMTAWAIVREAGGKP